VFQDPVEQQDFLAARSRRNIDWTRINARLASLTRASRETKNELLYREHRELFDGYWRELMERGRRPLPSEFDQWAEMRKEIGPPGQVERFLFSRFEETEFNIAQQNRKDDLLVYLAKANLRKKVPFSHLSISLREDMKQFFGKYPNALELGRELLFAAGDMDEIEIACEELQVGWQDEQALYFHRDVLSLLPPILRAYVGCAESLYGDANQADLLKLHKASGKMTFLVYDGFEEKPLPELCERIKVNLRSGWTVVFDHSKQGQLLYFKERFLAPDHPKQLKCQRLSKKLKSFGLEPANPSEGPPKQSLLEYLDAEGISRRNFGFRKSD
jgi:DNA phosphorothioation-associated putative methyltransferase